MDLVNSFFDIDTFARFLTFAIFVVAGLDLSKFVPQPRNLFVWCVLAGLTAAAGYLWWNYPTVIVFGFGVYLDMILFGLCGGVVVGLLLRWHPRFKMR